ncbi:adenylate/guanylate cyclase domain-containing protein [Caballeronia novacaledonica]|uniref:Adenylate/guanylate cyclase domain-containing protein n=1 Tax=Caballeronia novacaledonica TaxID=1544861 RepID=A0AA37IPT9_9BURK|nr:adenylate/guanylate cyclase domain-containing protein [Caballeronia novacaledonica]
MLGDLSEADLEALGLPLGDRKRLAKALAKLAGESAPGAPLEIQRANAVPSAAAAEAERRHVTVMFIDLIDSTSLAERFDPEDLRRVLGVFHEACVHAIETHEGHIAQYVGDGIVIYFGYPLAHEDDAVRAVFAGLAAVSALGPANDRLEAEHGVRLQMRIGIETGLVVAGEVGAGSSLDRQAAVGGPPIVAARLQSLAPPNAILVGPATERLIRGAFLLESMGSRVLKGIAAPVPVHRVLSAATGPGRFDIRANRGMTPLIGRSAELDTIRRCWKQSTAGRMRCVTLIGEPGIGKSRMLRAFTDSIGEDAPTTVSLQCSPYYFNSPFWPVLNWVQRAYGLDPKASDALNLERLYAGIGASGADAEEIVLVLATLLGIPTGERYATIDASSPSFKRRTSRALVALIESMADRKPVLLVIEDAHWIDPSSLELVRIVVAEMLSARLMVVLTARPEFRPEWTYPSLVRIGLDRLSHADCAAMIQRLTEGKPVPTVVLDEIVGKTDGVPLFVEELTKTVIQGGQLHDAGNRYELKGTRGSLAIPDTLKGALLSQLDRLEPGVKETAQIAATIGREFDAGLLALITSRPENELQRQLDSLVAVEIIVPATGAPEHSGAYLFRHALIQESAYQSLLIARRRECHGRIAVALEQRYPATVDRQPELIAENFAWSGQPDRAIAYWQRAGERALARAAYEEAIFHAQRGLEMADGRSTDGRNRVALTLPLLFIRGGAEHRLKRRDAIETFRRAAQIARAENLPSHVVSATLGFVAAEMFLGGDGNASIELLRAAVAFVGPDETVERCRLLSKLVLVLRMTGQSERSEEFAPEAVALARRLGDHTSLSDALAHQATRINGRTGEESLPRGQNETAKGSAEHREPIAATQRAADPNTSNVGRMRGLCERNVSIGDLLREHGDLNGSLLAFRRAQSVARHLIDEDASSAESLRQIIAIKWRIGDVRNMLGDPARALTAYRSAAAILRRVVGTVSSDDEWARDLGVLLRKIGDMEYAEGEMETALASYRESSLMAERLAESDPSNSTWQRDLSSIHERVGALLAHLGDLSDALTHWRESQLHLTRAAELDPLNREWQWVQATTQGKIGDLLAETGDQAGALAAYRDTLTVAKSLAEADSSNAMWQLNLSLAYRKVGDALRGRGEHSAALSAYRDSQSVAKRQLEIDPSDVGCSKNLGSIAWRIGDLSREQNDLAGSLVAYREALASFDRLAKADPPNAAFNRDLSALHGYIGDVLHDCGKVQEAIDSYVASLDAIRCLAGSDLSNTEWQRELLFGLGRLADLYERQGDRSRALDLAKQALSTLDRLASLDRTNLTSQRALAHHRLRVVRLGGRVR